MRQLSRRNFTTSIVSLVFLVAVSRDSIRLYFAIFALLITIWFLLSLKAERKIYKS